VTCPRHRRLQSHPDRIGERVGKWRRRSGPSAASPGIGERGARPSLSRPDANEHAFLESRRLHVADRVARKVHRDCGDLFMLGNTSWR
jgi:hypothetical protein